MVGKFSFEILKWWKIYGFFHVIIHVPENCFIRFFSELFWSDLLAILGRGLEIYSSDIVFATSSSLRWTFRWGCHNFLKMTNINSLFPSTRCLLLASRTTWVHYGIIKVRFSLYVKLSPGSVATNIRWCWIMTGGAGLNIVLPLTWEDWGTNLESWTMGGDY